MSGIPTLLQATESHALSLHGEPKYGPAFRHFDYADPDAVKGGNVKLHSIGTFDTLNPFTLKGVSAAGLSGLFDTLTEHANDEAFTEYGLLAETIERAPDNSAVTFVIRPEARFHDGSPVTVEDVVFTFETLKTEGHPFYRSYYASVESAEKTGDRKVTFRFTSNDNRELPLIIGQMPVLSQAYWKDRDFPKTTLEAPLGSGPYLVESVDPGRSITYRRNPDYWGVDLPVNRGRHNFDRIRYDYYRDGTVALEAFKAGEYDFRLENVSKDWATGYDGPALRSGVIKKENIPNQQPTGMQGFVFNARDEPFVDPRAREALTLAFDFEWTNKNLFYGAYDRTKSYFSNSELASHGAPGKAELEILEPYRGRISDAVFEANPEPPATDGSGNARANLREATQLLREAGWVIRDGRLVNSTNGKPFEFELMLVSPSFERVALPYRRNLKRLGIDMRVRTVDSAQYQKRLENHDFDMVVATISQSLSPGNEQRDFWSSEKADEPGSRNLAGIRDPVVDELVDAVINAPDRESLINRTQALDRVLLAGHYVVPHWHLRSFRVAYRDRFSRPGTSPPYALGFDTWWVDPDKDRALPDKAGAGKTSP